MTTFEIGLASLTSFSFARAAVRSRTFRIAIRLGSRCTASSSSDDLTCWKVEPDYGRSFTMFLIWFNMIGSATQYDQHE